MLPRSVLQAAAWRLPSFRQQWLAQHAALTGCCTAAVPQTYSSPPSVNLPLRHQAAQVEVSCLACSMFPSRAQTLGIRLSSSTTNGSTSTSSDGTSDNAGINDAESSSHSTELSAKERALVQLFAAGCHHDWDKLSGIAKEARKQGASDVELWGTVRHLIAFAGLPSCLAATIHLRQAGVLGEGPPGKVGGPPGNAFELVYGKVTDAVRSKLQHWDPVMAEYIRVHLYGDVYSSPGPGMRMKQLLSVSFLGEANMHDQLYTHAIAALRFGASQGSVDEAVSIGFAMSARSPEALQSLQLSAHDSVKRAQDKVAAAIARGGALPLEPTVVIPDPKSIRVPPLPPRSWTPTKK